MAKNPHFRVLALSATPGSDPEKVQNIINNLHISRIEIRDEQSMDIRAYVHKKVNSLLLLISLFLNVFAGNQAAYNCHE